MLYIKNKNVKKIHFNHRRMMSYPKVSLAN